MNETTRMNGHDAAEAAQTIPLSIEKKVESEVGDLNRQGKTFIKQNPFWVLLGAAVTGYALGTLFKNNSRRT